MASSIYKKAIDWLDTFETKLKEGPAEPTELPDGGWTYQSKSARDKLSEIDGLQKQGVGSYIPRAFFEQLIHGKLNLVTAEYTIAFYEEKSLTRRLMLKDTWFNEEDFILYVKPIKVPAHTRFDEFRIEIDGPGYPPVIIVTLPYAKTSGYKGTIAFPDNKCASIFVDVLKDNE